MKQNEENGIFIAIDGPNGSGKTTLINKLKEKFIQESNIVFTSEPTATKLGNTVRELSEIYKGNTLARLVVADRYEHLSSEIIPKLKNGDVVITDRYLLSSLILQRMDTVSKEFILKINEDIIIPNLQIVVLAKKEVIQERLNMRQTLTRFENLIQTENEIQYTSEGADILKTLNWNVLVIENSDNLINNVEKIYNEIKKIQESRN